jgi:DNA-binding XRE family transcriptional regulator
MMTADEAVAARKWLGLTQEELASDLGLTPHVVAAWENGTVRIPKSLEVQLRYEAAVAERHAAFSTSGLPECELDNAWASESIPDDLKGHTAYLERGLQHRTTCPTCLAREKYIEERFGKMPPIPMSNSMRVFGALFERIERLPRWARPGAWVAMAFGAYSIVRIVFALPLLVRSPEYWAVSFQGLAVSVSMGAAIGLLYGGSREVWERIRANRAR